jgi:hypothetical protein
MSSPPTAIPSSGWLQSGGPHAGVEDGDGGDERGRERGPVHAARVHTQVVPKTTAVVQDQLAVQGAGVDGQPAPGRGDAGEADDADLLACSPAR